MKRLTKEEALDLIKNADLKELGKMASARKKRVASKRDYNICNR
jgi:cyclic dehypoxanthinyl futalosine synthase